jgi:hypothetical protein
MPTARELLEQADALMRRNRGRLPEPDIPELTEEVDAVEPPPAAPRAAEREAVRSAAIDDDVPELTDAVEVRGMAEIGPLPEEGEESRWLDMDAGERSITGPAPDSIAVVPPATLRRAAPVASADVAPASREEAPPARPSAASDERKLAPTAVAALAAASAGTLAAGAATPAAHRDPAFDAMLGLSPAESDSEREVAPPSPGREVDAEAEPEAEPVPAMPEAVETVEIPAVAEVEDVAQEVPAAPAEAVAESAAAPLPPPASWDSVAEDIRMQVLQRIDIFTDTGLSAELATRLQPVVDRASADLVTTINREVGQLLRSYVAEAIEREIEKWRQGNP